VVKRTRKEKEGGTVIMVLENGGKFKLQGLSSKGSGKGHLSCSDEAGTSRYERMQEPGTLIKICFLRRGYGM